MSKKPTLIAYAVRDRGEGQKAIWTRIGAAWPHGTGRGLSIQLDALPIGTGNKTERLLGYFTWHADDTPPVNPIGDLFKSQVWELARYLGVPKRLIEKAPTADLQADQTDEADLGISYSRADAILAQLLLGYSDAQLVEHGFSRPEVALIRGRVDSTHWKRHLPTTAMLSSTAINEFYLRPVDY